MGQCGLQRSAMRQFCQRRKLFAKTCREAVRGTMGFEQECEQNKRGQQVPTEAYEWSDVDSYGACNEGLVQGLVVDAK